MNSMKSQKGRTLKNELPGSVGAKYAPGEEWGSNTRKKQEMEPERKQRPTADVTGDGSKVWCCKEQYCIGIWNIRSMNQGKLVVVKREMARVNTDILGVSELKWTWMGEFNSDDHYIYYCGQESLRRKGVALLLKKSPKCSSVQFSCSVVSDSLRPHESQHARPPCPSPSPGVHSDSSPSS